MRWALLAGTAAALAAAAPADALIQVDKGIAGARIGNSKGEVRAALGTPRRVIKGTNIFGPFTEFRFAGKIRVNFQGNRGVTRVSTTGRTDRTASGVGVGTREQRLRDQVDVDCSTFGGTRICQTIEGLPGQTGTFFFIEDGHISRIDIGIVID